MNLTTRKELLYAKLKVDIQEGKLSGKLPSEPALAKQLGVSRNTLRSVYHLLESDGLIVRHSGLGTRISDSARQGKKRYLFVWPTRPRHYTINHIMPSIMQGIEDGLPPGVELENCPVEHWLSLTYDEASAIRKARNIQGMIFNSSQFCGDEPLLKMIQKLDLPTVLVYCCREDARTTGLATVPRNTTEAWNAGLDYLRAIGHKNVLTLNAATLLIRDEFSPTQYEALLTKNGLNPDPALVIRSRLDDEEIYQNLSMVGRGFTAIVCYSDFFVPAVYRALKKLSLRVPEDVSVLGYCGSGGGDYLSPTLTTVEVDYRGAGAKAAELLNHSGEWYKLPGVKAPSVPVGFRIRQRRSTMPLFQTNPTLKGEADHV